MALQDTLAKYSEDIQSIEDFCEDIYNNLFRDHFKEIKNLYKKLKSKVNPISDSELEYILIMFPLELFSVAEKVNDIKLKYEVIKLKNREIIEQSRKEFIKQAKDNGLNKTETSEFVSRSLNECMVEYEVILAAYDSVLSRVASEQAFSKELIMGAKKVWDSRKVSESSNPVKPVKGDLPDYDPTSNKDYIK